MLRASGVRRFRSRRRRNRSRARNDRRGRSRYRAGDSHVPAIEIGDKITRAFDRWICRPFEPGGRPRKQTPPQQNRLRHGTPHSIARTASARAENVSSHEKCDEDAGVEVSAHRHLHPASAETNVPHPPRQTASCSKAREFIQVGGRTSVGTARFRGLATIRAASPCRRGVPARSDPAQPREAGRSSARHAQVSSSCRYCSMPQGASGTLTPPQAARAGRAARASAPAPRARSRQGPPSRPEARARRR